MVLTRGGHAVLIPAISFASGISKSIEHRCNLIIAVPDGHPTNNFQSLHRRRYLGRRTRTIHLQFSVYSTFPMNSEMQSLFVRIAARDDFLHDSAKNHFLERRRA